MIPPVQIGELKLPPVEARPAPSKPAHEEPAPVEAKSKPKPKPSGRYTPTERPAPPQNVPAPAPKGPTPARLSPLARPTPVPATEVVLTDLRYDENYEQEQSEMLFDAASRQLEKHLPLLAKCGLDQVYLDVNPKCTTKDHYWQVFSWKYMWITSEGKISANWSSDCVAQYLDGKSMPIGLIHGGQRVAPVRVLILVTNEVFPIALTPACFALVDCQEHGRGPGHRVAHGPAECPPAPFDVCSFAKYHSPSPLDPGNSIVFPAPVNTKTPAG
jgi:hypothetical protein